VVVHNKSSSCSTSTLAHEPPLSNAFRDGILSKYVKNYLLLIYSTKTNFFLIEVLYMWINSVVSKYIINSFLSSYIVYYKRKKNQWGTKWTYGTIWIEKQMTKKVNWNERNQCLWYRLNLLLPRMEWKFIHHHHEHLIFLSKLDNPFRRAQKTEFLSITPL